jgi:hypothetical protein
MTQAERIKKAVGEFGASAKAKLNEGEPTEFTGASDGNH